MKKIALLIACLVFVQTSLVLSEEAVDNKSGSTNVQANHPKEKNAQGKKADGKADIQPKVKRNASERKQGGAGKFQNENGGRKHSYNMGFHREDDPERFKLLAADAELDRKIKELVVQYRSAKTNNKKEEIRKKISNLCAKRFEVRQQRRELDLKRMKAWLQQMEEEVQKSRKNSAKIIEQRVKSLLDENLGEF